MKLKYILTLTIGLSSWASAAVTLQTNFGYALSSSGSSVATGTLWALVADVGNDGFGAFAVNGNLNASGLADSFFTTGQTLGIGSSIGGNTVFAMGGFNGADAGYTDNSIAGYNYGSNGAAAGVNFAFFFFPGTTYSGSGGTTGQTTSAHSQTIGSQVGGVSRTGAPDQGYNGMTLPSDGSNVNIGAISVSGSGVVPNSAFTAVNLIPEPSSALLGAFGALALLRRRRK